MSALTPGVIVAVQTFGDRINFHPHLHLLVTEGGIDRAGFFHRLPQLDDVRLTEIFAREVLRLLVDGGLLSPEWAERILSWRHTGFNVQRPRCGGRMKVVAFLTDYAVVDRIVGHLELTFVAEKPPPTQAFEQATLLAAEESGEYE